jgi:hypothetical protein
VETAGDTGAYVGTNIFHKGTIILTRYKHFDMGTIYCWDINGSSS